MSTFLQLIVEGRLGKDPELKYLPSGMAICNFTIATNEKYTKQSGEKVDQVTWTRVSVFGRTAENCNTYLHSGSKALCVGKLNPDENGNPRIWTKSDGTPAANYEMKADRVVFMDSKGDVVGEAGNAAPSEIDDEIPF
jgi:single-strand DNA-binding protein